MTTDTPCGPAACQPRLVEAARFLCKLGMTNDEVAAQFDIPLDTLLEWKESIPEFADTLWEGRALGDGRVADGLHRRAVGASHEAVRIFKPAGEEAVKVPYTRHYPPETPACKFWLQKRRPQNWGDKSEAQPNGDADDYTDEQLAAIVAEGGGQGPAVPKGRAQ